MARRYVFGSLSISLVVGGIACSSSDSGYGTLESATDTSADGSGDASGSGTSVSGGATTSAGASSTGGITPSTGSTTTGGSGETLNEEDICAAVTLESEAIQREVPMEITTTTEIEVPAPVAIYIVLDNSGSMDDGANGNNNAGGDSKWDQADAALTDFVNDPASEGVDVAIQYFHPQGQGGQVEECDGVAHAVPDVEMGPLPDNAGPIVNSLASTGPNGNTPTVGALTGGIDYCAAFQSLHPDEQCIVVLVTDGQPNGCGLTSDCGGNGGGNDCVDPLSEATLTPIASAGSSAGVTTFTVGMQGVTPEGFQLLNALAVAGGSDCTPNTAGAEACDVSATGGAGLLEALNTIRDTVVVTETITETSTETIVETVTLPCEWAMPLPPAGETLDPGLVNVVLEVSGVANALGQVPSSADCTTAGNGWYYDVPTAPTSIHICPETCTVVENNADVRVQVELGCETVPAVPK